MRVRYPVRYTVTMKTRLRLLFSALGLWMGLVVSSGLSEPAQRETPKPGTDVTRLGPQVGEKVPDFTLADQDGRARSLSSLMGDKGIVLVFSRSADW